jgi:hypothetical protein
MILNKYLKNSLTISLLILSYLSFAQQDTIVTQVQVEVKTNTSKSYYLEAGSYGTKRESDPPVYVQSLSKTNIKAFEKVDYIDFGLDYRSRVEYRHNDIRRSYLTTDTPLLLRTRAYIGIKNIIDPLRIVLEFEDATRVHGKFAPDDKDFNRAALIQAFAELNFKSLLAKDNLGNNRPVFVRFGRQAFEFLDRRLIASNQWRNTTNNFLGFRAAIGQDSNPWSVDLLALKPIVRNIKTIDEVAKDKEFWAVIGHWRRWSKVMTIEPYYLGLNQKAMTINANKARLVHSPGVRAYGFVNNKHINYDVTYTYQFGNDAGSKIKAYSFTSELGYKFNEHKWKPRISLFYGQVSGDKDSKDKIQNRFERFYGFGRPWSSDDYIISENIITPKLKLEFEPFKGVKIDGGYSYYWLESKTDRFNNLLSGSKNRDVTGNSGRFLGHGLDARARFKIFKLIDTNIGYTHYNNGDFVLNRQQAAIGKSSKTSDFAYVELSLNIFDVINKFASEK